MPRLSLPILAVVLAVAACAPEETPVAAAPCPVAGAVSIEGPWLRAQPDQGAMSAAYFTLCNGGANPISLASLSASVAGMVEAHETVTDPSGRKLMRPLEGLSIAPGERVVFQPGGSHLMLMDLKAPIAAGDVATITIGFSDGSSVSVDAVAKSPADAAHEGH
jgi:hypothetical protein